MSGGGFVQRFSQFVLSSEKLMRRNKPRTPGVQADMVSDLFIVIPVMPKDR